MVRTALAASVAALVLPGGALAATSAGDLFPSDSYTVADATQVTGLRVALPRPNCATNPSDCADVAILNQLDGFNIQPRLSIPFSGPIDLSTATSSNIFVVGPHMHKIGINQLVWSPRSNVLYAETDEQLEQTTTYLLVVTTGVRDSEGNPLEATTFRRDLNYGQTKDPAAKAYRKALLDALPMAMAGGVNPSDIAAASVFTTQTITATSEAIRSQLTGGAASFSPGGIFPVAGTLFRFNRQNSVAGPLTSSTLPSPLLAGVGSVAFGSYQSPNYETPAAVIPAVTVPAVQSTSTIGFTLFLPAGTPPAGGWPVAIFGHGFGDSRNGAPWAVAGTLASNGIATIAINVVGHGGGPLGTYTVTAPGAPPATFPAGGRSVDMNGDGVYGDSGTEGVSAVGANSLIGNRDGLRQTTIDLMQLVKVLRGGVLDLSTSRIYYAGQSFGGIYGVQLLGLEPDIRAGVPNVPGGPIIEIARLSPSFRPLVGISLISRVPSLYNAVPNPAFTSFVENMPLRNRPIVEATPDQLAIQALIENTEWAQQAANPAAYAPYLSQPVILQFARGDRTVPNPTTSAIIRAGDLASRTTLFRNDLSATASSNPHAWLTSVVGPGAPYALAGQQQIATFFLTDGATIVDPDGAGPVFETPTSMVPEDLGF